MSQYALASGEVTDRRSNRNYGAQERRPRPLKGEPTGKPTKRRPLAPPPYVVHSKALLASAAWVALVRWHRSAYAVLDRLERQILDGARNGQITYKHREAREGLGIDERTFKSAITTLEALDLIKAKYSPLRGEKRCLPTQYTITFLEKPAGNGLWYRPTNEWADIKVAGVTPDEVADPGCARNRVRLALARLDEGRASKRAAKAG